MHNSFIEYAQAVQDEHGVDKTITLQTIAHALAMANVKIVGEEMMVESFKPRIRHRKFFAKTTQLLRKLTFFI